MSSKSSGHLEGLGSNFATFLIFIIFTIAVKPVNSGLTIDYKPHFSSCEGNLPVPNFNFFFSNDCISGQGCITAICGSFAAGNNVSGEMSVENYLCFCVKIFCLSIQFPFLLIMYAYLKCLVSFKPL